MSFFGDILFVGHQHSDLYLLLQSSISFPQVYCELAHPYFAEPDTHLILNDDHLGNRILDAGTLPKIIEYLTSVDQVDKCFIESYSNVTKSKTLMQTLRNRFNTKIAITRGEEVTLFEREQLPIIRKNVVAFIQTWMDLCPEDFDHNLNQDLRELEIEIMVHNRYVAYFAEKLPIPRVVLPQLAPPIIKSNSELSPTVISILEFDPQEIASQLTLIDSELFCSIKRSECLGKHWLKENRKEEAPNIDLIVDRFKQFSNWVGHQILQYEEPEDRIRVYEKMIDIAYECLNLSNFHGVFSVACGLELACIHRLRRTQEAVSEEHKRRHSVIKEYLSRDLGFKTFRTAHKNLKPPCVPYIGLYLTDLTFIEEGSPQYIIRDDLKLINVDKLYKFSKVIDDLHEKQQQPQYNLQIHPELRALLLNIHVDVGQEEMYQRSLELEPRQKRDKP
jgi:son of sevenless-like protein